MPGTGSAATAGRGAAAKFNAASESAKSQPEISIFAEVVSAVDVGPLP
jgi:hypothetical protein